MRSNIKWKSGKFTVDVETEVQGAKHGPTGLGTGQPTSFHLAGWESVLIEALSGISTPFPVDLSTS